MPDEQRRLFEELAASRSGEHTGSRKKKLSYEVTVNTYAHIAGRWLS